VASQEIAGDIQRRRAAAAIAEHHRQKLGVGECRSALRKQPFARALARGPVGDIGHARSNKAVGT